ncbi:MAG: CsbD family protein [Polaromonas sp.]|nr:CsbD family protein [Polaromonas sp.]
MNKDQIKGSLKEAAGKAQAKAGDLMDSPKQQAKGVAKQGTGRAQKNRRDAKELLKDYDDKI